MEGEPDLPLPAPGPKFFRPNPSRPISVNPDSVNINHSFNTLSTCTSTTLPSSSSPPDLVRHFQAAFKRHRPLGMMQPRRNLVPQQETSKESNVKPYSTVDVKRRKEVIPQGHRLRGSVTESRSMVPVTCQSQEDASITPPSEWGVTVNTHEQNFKPYNTQRDQPGLSTRPGSNDTVEHRNVLAGGQKKVHFSTQNDALSHDKYIVNLRPDDQMATKIDDLMSHMHSLALTETEWDVANQVDAPAAVNRNWQHQNFESMEIDNSLRSKGGVSSLVARRPMGVQDQLNQLGNFLQNDLNNAMTQSSVVGSSCVTSTLINSTSAPMISSTTYCSQSQMGSACLDAEPAGQAEAQVDIGQPSDSLSKYAGGGLSHPSAVISQAINSITAQHMEVDKSSVPSKELQSSLPQEYNISKVSPQEDNCSARGNVTDIKYHPPSSVVPTTDMKHENSKSEKLDRGASGKGTSTSRKKGYDPDLFFKVNGKLYQRLGKIGSGGSSEVHKVISSDCKIYALKKIKLRGRDYATAYGFCQEIEYLNRLKGKDNIIQLIDYEVTDKILHQEVMNGSISNKDGRVKDDGYIYMVLEYGEIDLAHMLSQKWKELDGSKAIIDENWLRFYWQQILQAVNTIHEERIVHSDLKPANFLLVRGSLKLIDFGIAKAIMSDTTNIQRDSQVGTLSYMSPEAFLCNETDANGNTIKCGRPSDIWSLGCILYQMVYGRTPFSEYKTFWAKFKVITDPNHEIIYEPLSNPWLMDLMKKCLAWDRNERWRIPQLLQHPFLVPPVPPKLPTPIDHSCTLFQLVAGSSADDQKALMLCSQLESLVTDPKSALQPDTSVSREQLRELLSKVSDSLLSATRTVSKLIKRSEHDTYFCEIFLF